MADDPKPLSDEEIAAFDRLVEKGYAHGEDFARAKEGNRRYNALVRRIEDKIRAAKNHATYERGLGRTGRARRCEERVAMLEALLKEEPHASGSTPSAAPPPHSP